MFSIHQLPRSFAQPKGEGRPKSAAVPCLSASKFYPKQYDWDTTEHSLAKDILGVPEAARALPWGACITVPARLLPHGTQMSNETVCS